MRMGRKMMTPISRTTIAEPAIRPRRTDHGSILAARRRHPLTRRERGGHDTSPIFRDDRRVACRRLACKLPARYLRGTRRRDVSSGVHRDDGRQDRWDQNADHPTATTGDRR
jgi:hypothetical protein